MAAFRPDDAEERDMRLEDYGQHVTTDAFYPDWTGSEGETAGTCPAPSETLDLEAIAAAGLREAFAEISALLDRAAAA